MANLDLDDNFEQGSSRKSLKYMHQLVCVHTRLPLPSTSRALQQQIANRDQEMLVIDLEDIAEVSAGHPILYLQK